MKRETEIKKAIDRVTLTILFNPEKSMEIEPVIDTAATIVVLSNSLVRKFGLQKIEDVKVKYADGREDKKQVYGVVRLE